VLWKNHIRRSKRAASAQHLTDSLFLLNPTLRTALMRLRRLCFDAAEWGLFTCDRTRTYTLESFVALQNEKRVLVTTWLAEFSTDVSALVRSACDDVLDSFLASNSIHADHKMTFMERAALRTACRRLTKFVRLADFLVRDTLLGLALDSTQQLLSFLLPPAAQLPPRVIRTDMPKAVAMGEEAPLVHAGAQSAVGAAGSAVAAARKNKGAAAVTPMFVVSVSMEAPGSAGAATASRSRTRRRSSIERRRSIASDAGASDEPTLVLTPSLSVVRGALKSVLYDAMVVISAPQRLLNHADLLPYTRAASDDTEEPDAAASGSGEADVDLTEVVTTHVSYKRLAAEMFAGLDAAFGAVEEFCAVYRPYASTFLSNEGSVAVLDTRLTVASEVSEFESAIAMYRGQVAGFEHVPTSADIGILRVDSSEFKRRLLPSPIKCLQALRELLPQVRCRAGGHHHHCVIFHLPVLQMLPPLCAVPAAHWPPHPHADLRRAWDAQRTLFEPSRGGGIRTEGRDAREGDGGPSGPPGQRGARSLAGRHHGG
jgi:dynein heavy chain, axonemal